MTPLLTPFHKTTCPYCFEQFHLGDAPWRPMANTNLQPDAAVQAFFDLDQPPDLPALVPSGNDGVKPWHRSRFLLDNSRLRDHDRVCPFCHLPLPLAQATGELTSQVIAVVGERWSGKSSYFGVLLHQLVDGQLASEAGFGVVAQTTWDMKARRKVSSSTVYEERYGQYLYAKPRGKIPPTRRLSEHRDLRSPLIYRLQFFKRDATGRLARPIRIVRATDLVLFDTGGEDFEDPHSMTLTLRYLTRAAGIIFLVNPLRLSRVRDQLFPEVQDRMEEAEREEVSVSGDILDTFLNLFDRDPRYGALRPIKTPVAVALTKTDMLGGLIQPGSRLNTEPSHVNGFDLDDALRVSTEVREQIVRWAGGAVAANLVRFTNAGYFGVSSLGCQPEPDGTIPALEPRRVGDPLFWILNRLGYLPARKPAPSVREER